jgi:SAM-dependent methyltransferase
VPAPPDRPRRPGAAETQLWSRQLAENTVTWAPADAAAAVDDYARLAPCWDTERGGYRPVPLADALARGGPLPTGICAQVGAGTGLLTPMLLAVWPSVIDIDLSPDMLARSDAPWRVRADASRLPLPDGVVAAVVLADAPFFAVEVDRVLAPDGVVVWSNALGDAAPHHVPTAVLLRALAAGRTAWRAVTSEAGWGSWAVFRRA